MPRKVLTGKVVMSFVLDTETQPESNVDCAGCSAPCCRTHQNFVFVTVEEARRLPVSILNIVLPDGERVPNAVVLARHPITGDCVFLQSDGRCGNYENRPSVCRQYDCRQDPRMTDFVQLRWPRQSG